MPRNKDIRFIAEAVMWWKPFCGEGNMKPGDFLDNGETLIICKSAQLTTDFNPYLKSGDTFEVLEKILDVTGVNAPLSFEKSADSVLLLFQPWKVFSCFQVRSEDKDLKIAICEMALKLFKKE